MMLLFLFQSFIIEFMKPIMIILGVLLVVGIISLYLFNIKKGKEIADERTGAMTSTYKKAENLKEEALSSREEMFEDAGFDDDSDDDSDDE